MTGMTETVGMVPITNINPPGGFRIGRVGKVYPHYFEVKVKDRWQNNNEDGNGDKENTKMVPVAIANGKERLAAGIQQGRGRCCAGDGERVWDISTTGGGGVW